MTESLITASITVKSNHTRRKIGRVKAAGDEAVDLASNAILQEALRLVRVGATHKIRDGLRIRTLAEGTKAVGVWGVKEAGFVERGTVKMHAAPYLRPGSTIGRRVLKEAAEAKVREAAEET